MTAGPASDTDPSHGCVTQNGPSSSTCDPHLTNTHDSSDNDEDSEDEALRKEINRLREK